MLQRKIEKALEEWKNLPSHKPLIVKGCRQCGKTYSVKVFAEKNYAHVIYLNFFETPAYAAIFSDSMDVNYFIMMITAMQPDAVFEPGNTVVILDEIQECPQARTALKFFHLDGRFDVIGTGSLLGVKGYGKEPKSIPVGYETVLDMYPLDFEEFLWATGVPALVIQELKRHLQEESPIPEALHKMMRERMLQYAVVGGMPDAVQTFVVTRQLNLVLQIQRDIVRSYEDDMVKYAVGQDKANIKQCFASIPRQLSKENKKFQYSVVQKGSTAARYAGCLQWIEDAGIIRRCYNMNIPELPLDGNATEDCFKVYMQDMGLFVSMLEDGTQADILQGNLYGYKGAVFENLVADFLTKMGRKLYYYHKDSGLEIDFILRWRSGCVLLEAKATTGNVKSTKTVLNHPEKYHVAQAIKLGDYNIGRNGQILTLPMYMGFLLTDF